MSGFADIHCHILPGLDDGPKSAEESLQMLDIAKKDGIDIIVATPHIKQGIYDATIKEIKEKIARLKEIAGDSSLLLGADVSVSARLLSDLKSGEVLFLNEKNYLLLEFPAFSMPPMDYVDDLLSILKEMEIYPLVTHPERNALLLNNIDAIKNLVTKGIYFQVTAMSITGEFGKEIQKFTKKLLKNGLVHVIASDAHDPINRPPILSRAFEKITKEFNADLARQVCITNPGEIVSGNKIAR